MSPANEFPGNVIYFALFIGFVWFFLYSAGVRLAWLPKSQGVNRFDHLVERTAGMVPFLLGNSRVARPKYWYSGMLHTLIWWGFIVLQVRTLNFLLNGIDHSLSFEEIIGDPYVYVMWPMMDMFNLLVLVGVAMAAFQRFFVRPPRLTLNMDAWIILGLLTLLMVSDILVNSFEIDLTNPEHKELAFVAYAVSEVWDAIGMSINTAQRFLNVFWYVHLLTFLTFLCYLPYSKHSHVLTIPFQVFTRRVEPTGILQPIPNIEEAESFGVGKLQQFTWKQLLDSYSCTECGRCTAACPANITGKLLSPKHVIHDIRLLMEEQEPAVLPANRKLKPETPTALIEGVGFEQIWDCVTCGACMEECPVFIEHVPTIMDMRRYLVMEESNMPETAQQTLMQIEQRGHPWRGTQMTRTQWIEELASEGVDVPAFDGSQEYLYWVGCTGALQERNVKVTKSFVRLLLEAGVSFGVLGLEEGCSGDPARRLGNEYLYQLQAQQNIEVFKAKNVQKVIASCPHCFNTISHEYPQFDGNFETIHHSVFLAQLIEQGKIKPDATNSMSDKSTTYHDPCYLSRHNNIMDEPRSVLSAIGIQQQEMGRCRKGTFCCGAGGSHMWVEESRGERINNVRSSEAVDTGADIISVACPFCMQMFESGLGSVPAAEERGVQVFDLAELLEQSVAYGRPVGGSGNGNGGGPAAPAEPEPAVSTGVSAEAAEAGETPGG